MLLSDLKEMVENWEKGGKARKELENANEERGIFTILKGMGSLSYGELAGERMKLGSLLHDQEEEQDCFSDNTHYANLHAAQGIREIYLGQYISQFDHSSLKGISLSDLIKEKNPQLHQELMKKFDETLLKLDNIKKRVEQGEPYDQQIAKNNKKGNALVEEAIDALLNKTKILAKIAEKLKLSDLSFETSESFEDLETIFQ